MKKILLITVIIIIGCCIGMPELKAAVAGNVTTAVNVRSKATTNSSKIVTLKKNAAVSLINTTKTKGSGCLAGWYKMTYKGTTRYVCSSYVKVKNTVKLGYSKVGKATTTVYIRSKAMSNSTRIYTAKKNTNIYMVNTTKYKGSGCSGGWYKIVHANQYRYICSNYVKVPSTPAPKPTPAPTPTPAPSNGKQLDAYINSTALNLRSGAGTNYGSLGSFEFGTQLKLLSTSKYTGSGCSAGWYKVQFTVDKLTRTGYACSSYIYKYSDIKKTDNTYAATLRKAGFPETYIPYLSYLHSKYPKWKFVAEKNNLDWKNSVTIESKGSTSLIQTSRSSYKQSNTVYDGTNWYAAHPDVVGVYLDPRNFLTEKNIFMFENLKYDGNTSTYALLKSLLGSSYLYTENAESFIKSSKQNDISARHLGARAISETGLKGGKATSGAEFTYDGTKYKGYYNFFNIGATNGTNAYINGLAYAAKLKGNTAYGVAWDTPAKSIIGGGEFISGQYVKKGQDTTYYQKFNTSVNRKLDAYTHQYMQNIKAPSVEASDTFNSLQAANMHTYAFTFKIPVYNNMPNYTVLP